MNSKILLCFLLSLFYLSIVYSKDQLHVCTVATQETSAFTYLSQSCIEKGHQLVVLGLGKKFDGNFMKLRWMQEYIDQLLDDDILLFIDGYDVLILAEESEVIEKFKAMNATFIIGTEPILFPAAARKELLLAYPSSPTKFRFINSGCYIGYVWAVRKILNDLLTQDYQNYINDQWRFHKHFLKNMDLYTLDYQSNLFLNLSRVPFKHLDIDFKQKRLLHKPTQTVPIAIHGCGLRKPFIEKVGKLFFDNSHKDNLYMISTIIQPKSSESK